jgi:hypothetical protein
MERMEWMLSQTQPDCAFTAKGSLGEILHHERDVLFGVFDTRLGTRMRRLKREPAFEPARLNDGKGFGPIY